MKGRFTRRGGSSAETSRRVRELVRPHRRRVVLLAAESLVGGLIEATFLVVVTRVALAIADDRGRAGIVASWYVSIPTAVGMAAILLVVRLGLALLAVRTSTSLSITVSMGMRRELADAYLRSSWAVQQAEPSGRLVQLLTGFVGSSSAVIGAVTSMLGASLSLGAMLIVSLLIDPIATIVVIAALVGLGSVLAPIRRRIRLRSQVAARYGLAFGNAVSELGVLGLEMQTYGVRDQFSARIEELTVAEATARRRADVLRGALAPTYTALAYGALVLGLTVAAMVGVKELSGVGAVMLVMLRSLSYGQQVQVASAALLGSMPAVDQIDAVLAQYRSSPAVSGDVQLSAIGPLEATGVSFRYRDDQPVLRDLTFRLEPGEVVGVIGPSGAGKSTLVQLLLGVREPTSGTISIDGTDLRNVDRTSWARLVAFVAQDANMYSGTAADNVRFFRQHIDDEIVLLAAERAQVLADIEAMEDGIHTPLGDHGLRLSGGQRQRLSIARAFAGEPQLLVLDEPTASLDPFTEASIRDTLTGLKGRSTVVVIAHRMSTLEMCDRIMVIEGGRMVAFDRPDVLRAQSEFYRRALELSGIA